MVLARYELAKSIVSARGVLFLVLYGVVWFWVLWKLSEGHAGLLAQPEGSMVAAWLLDPTVAKHLFLDNPPTLSAFFLLSLSILPIFVLWGAGDQTASDIGNKHLRFLIPRCGRLEIYVGRFLGALAFIFAFHLIVVALATIITTFVDPQSGGDVFGFSLHVAFAVLIYTLPWVALMAVAGALTGSAPIAVLTAIATYAVIGIAASLLSMSMPQAEWLGYLLPAVMKPQLLSADFVDVLVAAAAMLVYTIVYLIAGWQVFRRRDI